MLDYLDNAQSVGPDSPVGRRDKRGLNENLAREILELHTLGVDGGYTPSRRHRIRAHPDGLDRWPGAKAGLGAPGAFVFNVDAHEPGVRTLLGRSYTRGRRRAGRGGARRSRPLAGDRPPHRSQIRARLRRRRRRRRPSSTRLARKFSRTGRRSRRLGPRAGRRRRRLERAGDEAARSLANDDRRPSRAAARRRQAGTPRLGARRAGDAAVEPGRAQRLSRISADAWASPEGIKTRVEIAAGLGAFGQGRAAAARPHRPRAARRQPSSTRADGAARGIAAAGLCAADSVAGVPEEMSMIADLDRRRFLGGAGAVFAAANLPRVASAAGARDPRLVVIILRGALDGLSAVGPVGDPEYVEAARELALRLDGPHAALPLDGFFGAQPGDEEFRPALRRQAGAGACMRRRPTIASARISTARTCLKAACRRPAAPKAAGSTGRSRKLPVAGRAEGEGARGRLCAAAGAARPGADARLGAGGAAGAGRRPRRPRLGALYDHADPISRERCAPGFEADRQASAMAGMKPRAATWSSRCARRRKARRG